MRQGDIEEKKKYEKRSETTRPSRRRGMCSEETERRKKGREVKEGEERESK